VKGSLKQRSPGHWAIILDVRDQTGKRRRKWHAFRGNKREAQAECARLIASMDAGEYVETHKLTVGKYLLDRLAQWEAGKKIGAQCVERYRELITGQICPFIGEIKLQALRTIDLERWHNALIDHGRKNGKSLSTRTVGAAHRLLSKALREAVKHGLIVKNVASLERPPKVDGKEVRIIGADRLEHLLDRLGESPLRPKVLIALFCGLRLGEVLALKWGAVDLDAKTLSIAASLEETQQYGVREKRPKTGAGIRDVTMPDIVVEALRKHRQEMRELRLLLGLGKLSDDDLLFPRAPEGGLPSPQQLTNQWWSFAKRIGMPDITFHALRHTHASMLIAAGINVVEVSKRLGHAKPSTTLDVYAHLFRQKDDAAAAAINAALANLGAKG
jgi:integrase